MEIHKTYFFISFISSYMDLQAIPILFWCYCCHCFTLGYRCLWCLGCHVPKTVINYLLVAGTSMSSFRKLNWLIDWLIDISEISYQIKCAFTNAGINTTFLSAPKLKDILCSRNTTKNPKEQKKGITNTNAHAPLTPPTSDKPASPAPSLARTWERHHQRTMHPLFQNQKLFSVTIRLLHNMQGKNKKYTTSIQHVYLRSPRDS